MSKKELIDSEPELEVEVEIEEIPVLLDEEKVAPAEKKLNAIDAYHLGVVAFMDGKERHDNPYEKDNPLRFEWARGWLDTRRLDETPRKFQSIWESIQNDFDALEKKQSAY